MSARPRYRLLALDIDGTLLRSDKTVSPRTLGALRAAQEGGVKLVLVTGRRLPAARRAAAALGPVDLVLHNGALVADGLPQEVMASPIVQEAYLGVEAARA